MSIQIIDDSFDKHLYNSKAVHPLQSWEWGEARKAMGIEVLRIGEFNTSITNVYQITLHPLPHIGYKIGYLPRSHMPSKEMINFIHQHLKARKVAFVKIEPNVHNNYTDNTLSSLARSEHALFPDWTIQLPLTQSEDQLLAALKPKTRYNIKLATKKGVTVAEHSDDKGFQTFVDLYFQTCKRQKYRGHTPEYHKIIWSHLKNNIAHILIASYEGRPLAAYELFIFNNILYYPYGGSSDSNKNVMAPNILMWEAIRFGKKMGATLFDMWGAAPPHYTESDGWSGFTRFKEGYGGEFKQFIGSYDLIMNHNLYKLYGMAHKIRSKFLAYLP